MLFPSCQNKVQLCLDSKSDEGTINRKRLCASGKLCLDSKSDEGTMWWYRWWRNRQLCLDSKSDEGTIKNPRA